jgi:aminopeptidase N
MRHRLGWWENTVNLGNFFPIAAVYQEGAFRADPYSPWGDPFLSTVANYSVSITAPERFIAAMSGETDRGAAQNGTVTTSSIIHNARDFAIVLSEFTVKEASVDGIAVRYYYVSDSTPDLSLKAASDSIKTFGNLFGDYPYKSFSVVQTPFLHGGMEYPGLVMISDRLEGEIYREVIIHEAAHQWWYAVVGNDQIKHAWLDETLAEYSTTLFYEENPEYNISYAARIADATNAYSLFHDMYSRESFFSSVMQRPLNSFHSAREYTYLTYVKGQMMHDAVRSQIGRDNFIAGLRLFYEENKFSIASPDRLIAALETASNREVGPIVMAWVEGRVQMFAS